MQTFTRVCIENIRFSNHTLSLDLFLKCILSHLYSRATATMNYHHNPLDTESNTYAKAILQGGYSPPSTEPLYEVPKYTQEELEQPKSSSTGMCKT